MTHFPATYLDGNSAGRHPACLRADADDLLILRDDGRDVTRWPLHDVRVLRDRGLRDRMILRAGDRADRLVLETPEAAAWIATVAPHLRAPLRDRLGLRRVALWGAGAAAALGLMLFAIIPGLAVQLAPLIPPEQEAALGRETRDRAAAMLSSRPPEQRFCTQRQGVAALQRMTATLMAQTETPYRLDLAVVAAPQVNAFAAPGGYVVLLDGLIAAAESPNEVAAVLAHEIGHVVARDPTRSALRAAGSAGLLSLAIGDVAGGAVIAGIATQLIDAGYSRRAETAADAFAARMLEEAGVAPTALADFFDRLAEEYGDLPEFLAYFSTHPAPETRSARIRSSTAAGRDRPILSPQEWQALQDICTRRGPSP